MQGIVFLPACLKLKPAFERVLSVLNVVFFVSFLPTKTGLPTDITEEEFVTLMSKYGIIMEDPETSMKSFFCVFFMTRCSSR